VTQPAAGWYADPAGGQSERFWDGVQWSDSTRPLPSSQPQAGYLPQGADPSAPAYAAPQPYGGQQPYGQQQYGQQPYGQPQFPGQQGYAGQAGQPAGGTLYQRNRYTAYTVLVGIVYVLLAFAAHFVLIGVLPILFTVRAFRGKEPLAPLAAVVAAIAVIFSIFLLV
jgi:hypothetical protein